MNNFKNEEKIKNMLIGNIKYREKQIKEDFKKRLLWFINEVEKDPHQLYKQPVLYKIKFFIEKME